jgi:hypothetical protein
MGMMISRRQAMGTGVAALAAVSLPRWAEAKDKAKPPVEIKRPELLTGLSQVGIFAFTVAFLTERKASAKAGGGLLGGGFGGKSTARSALVGVSDSDFQAATDAAYAHFSAQLAAAGIAPVDYASVAAHHDSNFKLLENGHERDLLESRNASGKARLFGPAAIGAPIQLQEWGDALTGGGFNFARHMIFASQSAKAFAKASGVPAIAALLVVDFADAETYGGAFRNSSAVKVDSNLAIMGERSRIEIFAPNGKTGRIALGDDVATSGDFGSFDDSTSGGHKAAETVANVIGLLGGIGSNKSRRYTMTADPARWRSGLDELSREALTRLVQPLSTR